MLDFIRSVRTVRKNETTDRCRSMKQHRDYLSELNAFQTATESAEPSRTRQAEYCYIKR